MYLKHRHSSYPTGYILQSAQYYLFLRNAGPEEPVFIEIHVSPSGRPRMIFRMKGPVEASIWNHCGIKMLPQEIKEWFAEHLRIRIRRLGENISMTVALHPFYLERATERLPEEFASRRHRRTEPTESLSVFRNYSGPRG